MADTDRVRKTAIAIVLGSVATTVALFGLMSPGTQATQAAPTADDPDPTLTASATLMPTWWPSPRPTRTPCSACTPLPTWTPWWTPETTCVPGTNCGTPRPTRTPCDTCTPPPPRPTASGTATPQRPLLALRPSVQFGRPGPDGNAHYRLELLNRFAATPAALIPVDLRGISERRWPVSVRPERLVAHPGVPNTISITVDVPPTRTFAVDVERTIAVGGTPPRVFTATAHLITIAFRRPFTDVPEDYWADDGVQYLAALRVVSGYSDGSFRPNEGVTRAQFAKMLVGVMGWTVWTPAAPTFSDVDRDFWAYGYIETAAAHGVISGYSDGTFRPASGVTRAQIAKIVVTAQGWPLDDGPPTGSFSDVTEDDWLYSYAETINAAGVMEGYSDGTFRPYSYASRAQIAKILTLSLYSNPNN